MEEFVIMGYNLRCPGVEPSGSSFVEWFLFSVFDFVVVSLCRCSGPLLRGKSHRGLRDGGRIMILCSRVSKSFILLINRMLSPK